MTPTDLDDARRVLFVDDDPIVRNAFARSMARYGFDIDTASGVLDAVAKVRRYPYPVVATDLGMPDLDGVCLLQHLSRLSPETRFLVVTGMGDIDLPVDADLDQSVVSIVAKPWDDDELADMLERASRLHERKPLPQPNTTPPIRILLLEDEADDADRIERELHQTGTCSVVRAERLRAGLELARSEEFDVALADLALPDARGLDVVRELGKVAPDIAVVVLGERHRADLASHAIQLGAQDYIVKRRLERDRLESVVRCALERKRGERRLAKLAHYDPLTGLANRKLFEERLDAAVRRVRRTAVHGGSSLSVLFLDLDRFKSINDALGHAVGDTLLRETAARIRSCVRPGDTVSRFGGDEFAVLLESVRSPEEAQCVAERILGALEKPVKLDRTEVVATTSIGVAVYPDAGDEAFELVKAADAAMYQAKESGRNTARVFVGQSKSDALAKLQLENDLRNAIRHSEFVLHYQPQYCMRTSALVGMEALLRWRRPDGVFSHPADFIGTLEETGSIIAVGDWVIRTACRQLRGWRDAGVDVPRVAVNVCAQQFEHPELVGTVVKSALEAGIPLGALELELTESSLMQDVDRAVETLRELDSLGVRVAVDDFGTGYASLAYLRRFPVKTLKIDRLFVQDVGPGSETTAIAGAIIDLGHRLGMDVVAEGVESEAQLRFLRAEGCDSVQGYLLGRPGPAHVVVGGVRSSTPAGGMPIPLGTEEALPEERPTVRPPANLRTDAPGPARASFSRRAV